MIGIEILASATEFFCGILVLAAFFARREGNKWLAGSVMLIGCLMHLCLSTFTNSWPLTIRMAFVVANWFLVSGICFRGNGWKRILIISLFWAVTFAIDMSVLTACMTIMNWSAQAVVSQDTAYLLGILSSRSLLLSISSGCGYFVKRQKKKHEGSGAIWVCLLLIPLYTIVGTGALITNAMKGGVLSGTVIALSGGLLCVNVLLCVVVNKLEQNRLAEEEKQQLRAESQHNLELAKTYQDSFRQQRKISHEFRNQLDTVGSLLAEGAYDRAAGYVRHLQRTSQEIVPLIHTNHPMIDAVLNQKCRQAGDKGIGILFHLNDLSGIPMEDADIVTLIGNILDNAISASEQTQEKQIWVKLWQEQGIYQLVVRNSCPACPVERTGRERMLHGFGLELVKAVLEKYSYPFYAEQIDNKFVFSAILG